MLINAVEPEECRIAILENNQTKEGTVKIPKVLQGFMEKEEIGV